MFPTVLKLLQDAEPRCHFSKNVVISPVNDRTRVFKTDRTPDRTFKKISKPDRTGQKPDRTRVGVFRNFLMVRWSVVDVDEMSDIEIDELSDDDHVEAVEG